jgi:hypothetical protein
VLSLISRQRLTTTLSARQTSTASGYATAVDARRAVGEFRNEPAVERNAGSDPFAIEGRKLDPSNLTSAGWQLVGANYLKTLGIHAC